MADWNIEDILTDTITADTVRAEFPHDTVLDDNGTLCARGRDAERRVRTWATTHTTEAAPRATEAQLTYLQDLLRRCNPDNLPELPGPTTPDALAALTKTEASTYIDAVKRAMDPPGPARPLPRDAYPDAVRGEVTIRFAVDGTVIWKTTAPGAPEAHGTAANASETVTAVLDTVESTPYRTDDAPHGWSTPIMDRSTFKLPTGTFTLRPVTEEDVAAAQRAANRPSLRSRIGAGRRTQGEQA